MILYGVKYKNKEREEIKKIINQPKYKNLTKDYLENLNLPKGFLKPNIFNNKPLAEVVKSMEFSFNNSRNVLIIGDEGDRTAQLAFWFSEWYKREKIKEKDKRFHLL